MEGESAGIFCRAAWPLMAAFADWRHPKPRRLYGGKVGVDAAYRSMRKSCPIGSFDLGPLLLHRKTNGLSDQGLHTGKALLPAPIPPNRPGTPGRYRSRKHHIQAHQPRAATGRLDQRRRNDGRDAGRENARELVDEGNASVAYLGVEQVAEEGRLGTVDRRVENADCLLYTSPSPRDLSTSRMPSSA